MECALPWYEPDFLDLCWPLWGIGPVNPEDKPIALDRSALLTMVGQVSSAIRLGAGVSEPRCQSGDLLADGSSQCAHIVQESRVGECLMLAFLVIDLGIAGHPDCRHWRGLAASPARAVR